jgi:hypothetical protein
MKYTFLLLFLVCNQVIAQTDSTNIYLDQVTVTANISKSELIQTARNVTVISAKQIEQSPVKTIDGILQYALGVDVRSRSPFGVQSDVSIRGGNFEQTLVLIDGVKMNDPQTGHHNTNQAVMLNNLEKIEILNIDRDSLIKIIELRHDCKFDKVLLMDVLEHAFKAGSTFDAWSEHFKYENWANAFIEIGIDPKFYASRERSYDEVLPWDFIDIGVHKSFLQDEYENSKKALITPNCMEDCMACGATCYGGGICFEDKTKVQ